MSYYQDKLEILRDIFGTRQLSLTESHLHVGDKSYPILNDVIILLEPAQYTPSVKNSLRVGSYPQVESTLFAEDIQFPFGEEWALHPQILKEHAKEFSSYFDLIDLESLQNQRVCDLGCGNGRWSYFLAPKCRELILIDFSDAIFSARRNLTHSTNCLFFMGDLQKLPLKERFCDFLFCLGVLHHLPTPCLNATRDLKRYADTLLVFLYYALDNRPLHYRMILGIVTQIRWFLSKIRNQSFRTFFIFLVTALVYKPMVLLGRCLKPLGISSHVPLFDFYHDKGFRRIQQDVYDRFFTRIEQRVTRQQIQELQNSFSTLEISKNMPYWHFVCRS